MPRFTIGALAVYATQKTSNFKRLLPTTSLLILFLLTLFIQSFSPFITLRSYELSNQARALAGESRDDTAEYLKLSDDGSSYSFAVPETELDNAVHTGRVADAYSASLSTKAKDGITVTEKNSKIAVTLIPDFYVQDGQKVDGDHLVYPTGPDKLVYTLKYNGLKEDIIVPQYRSDELSYKFTLRLPSGVEARLDEQGNIGIYSSDPTLFGDISFGSDEDREKIELARQNSEKTNLVMTIPYPIIKDATGQEYTDRSTFELGNKKQTKNQEVRTDLPPEIPRSLVTNNEYSLTIKSERLNELTYPIAIDPTMQVKSANEFTGVVPNNSIDVDVSSSEIRRGNLTGGALSAWTTSAATLASADRHSSGAVIDGTFVLMQTSSYQYADLDADPTLSGGLTTVSNSSGALSQGAPIKYYQGRWYAATATNGIQLTSPFKLGSPVSVSTGLAYNTDERRGVTMEIHNGWIYVVGGCVDDGFLGNNGCGDNSGKNFVSRAPINADGTIGAWASTATMTTRKTHSAVAVYNDRLYVMGGCYEGKGNGYSCTDTFSFVVEYALINSDGSLGTFVTTTSVPTHGSSLGPDVIAVNGYFYYFRADRDASATGDIHYAEIYPDGSVGAWRATSSQVLPRSDMGLFSHNNYVYIFGGCELSTCGNTNKIEYTTIKPAGWVGAGLTEADVLSQVRSNHVQLIYNGYLYVLGGRTNGTTILDTVEYTQILSDGSLGAWSTTTSLPGFRYYGAGFVNGGYMYFLGGTGGALADTAFENHQNTVYYASINTNGTLGSWSTTTSLPTTRRTNTATAYNGYAYHLGGFNGSYHNSTHYAQINSNGTLGSWVATESFTNARSGHRVVASKGHLYVIGGWNGSTTYSDVQYASINSNGSINAWAATTSMPSERRVFLASVYKGYIYVTGGGYDSTSVRDTSSFAPINNDGTVGAWSTSTAVMAEGRALAEGDSIYNDIIYAAAGDDPGGSGYRNSTYYARINNGGSGSLKTMTSTTGLLDPDGVGSKTAGRTFAGAVIADSCMFIIGGADIDENFNTVQSAPILATGALGSWTNRTSLPAAAARPRGVYHNGYIYAYDSPSGALYRGAVTVATCTVSWTTLASSNFAHVNSALHYYNGYFYIAGGTVAGSPSATTEYVQVNQDGSIGVWQNGTTMNVAHGTGQSAIANGYLYVMGGCVDTGSGHCQQAGDSDTKYVVEYAPINSNGSLGVWVKTTQLPKDRFSLGSPKTMVMNGYIYLFGGRDDNFATASNILYKAPILPNGGVGTWEKSSTNLTEGVYAQAFAYNATHFYILGGNGSSSGNYSSSTYYGTINSITRKGSFTRRYDFNTGVKPTKLVTRGTKQNGAVVSVAQQSNVACGATVYDNPQTIADTGYTGANAATMNIGSARTLARCMTLRYTINDSNSAVFPDAGNETTITDFDLYFTSNPGSRLRGGRTFTNGQDRGLDAAPQ